MTDYLFDKARILVDRISEQRARELYEEARTRPDSDLEGDLETGFHYWDAPDGIKLVRFHVTPLP
jgi:hypothetical protein